MLCPTQTRKTTPEKYITKATLL